MLGYVVLDKETKEPMDVEKYNLLRKKAEADWKYEYELEHGFPPKHSYYKMFAYPSKKIYSSPGPASSNISSLHPTMKEAFDVFALDTQMATPYVVKKKRKK